MSLSQFKNNMDAVKRKMEEDGKEALKEEFKTLFDEYPTLEAMSFEVWTCSFNDGSPCYCSVHRIQYQFNNLTDEQKADLENEDGWCGEDERYGKSENLKSVRDFMSNDRIMKLERDLEGMVDILQVVLGDPVVVLVNREGINVEACNPAY